MKLNLIKKLSFTTAIASLALSAASLHGMEESIKDSIYSTNTYSESELLYLLQEGRFTPPANESNLIDTVSGVLKHYQISTNEYVIACNMMSSSVAPGTYHPTIDQKTYFVVVRGNGQVEVDGNDYKIICRSLINAYRGKEANPPVYTLYINEEPILDFYKYGTVRGKPTLIFSVAPEALDFILASQENTAH
jgi:hypothetical protein